MAHSSWVGQTNASERCKAIESSQRAGQADGIASILSFMHDGVVTLQHQWPWAEPRWSLPGNRNKILASRDGKVRPTDLWDTGAFPCNEFQCDGLMAVWRPAR